MKMQEQLLNLKKCTRQEYLQSRLISGSALRLVDVNWEDVIDRTGQCITGDLTDIPSGYQ